MSTLRTYERIWKDALTGEHHITEITVDLKDVYCVETVHDNHEFWEAANRPVCWLSTIYEHYCILRNKKQIENEWKEFKKQERVLFEKLN